MKRFVKPRLWLASLTSFLGLSGVRFPPLRTIALFALLPSLFASCADSFDEASFNEELRLAQQAPDRDTRVEHLRGALECRPDHPENLVIQMKIGVELTQRTPTPEQPLRREEGLEIFESICNNYSIMDYYETDGPDSLDSPQGILPRAAIYAGDLHASLNRDGDTGQAYYHKAMTWLNEIQDRRTQDWLNTPPPDEDSEFYRGPAGKAKYELVLKEVEQRQKDAREGNVLNYREVSYAKTAVKHFAMAHGPQPPESVADAMRTIIEDFPGTPMEKFARERLEQGPRLED